MHLPERSVLREELLVGDTVWSVNLGKEGRLLRLMGAQAEVQVGQFRVKVDLKDLKFSPLR